MAEVLFNIFEILVTIVFGSIGLAIIGVYFVLLLIMFLGRFSSLFIIMWTIMFFVVMGSFYLGALGLILSFFAAFIYAATALIRLGSGGT